METTRLPRKVLDILQPIAHASGLYHMPTSQCPDDNLGIRRPGIEFRDCSLVYVDNLDGEYHAMRVDICTDYDKTPLNI